MEETLPPELSLGKCRRNPHRTIGKKLLYLRKSTQPAIKQRAFSDAELA